MRFFSFRRSPQLCWYKNKTFDWLTQFLFPMAPAKWDCISAYRWNMCVKCVYKSINLLYYYLHNFKGMKIWYADKYNFQHIQCSWRAATAENAWNAWTRRGCTLKWAEITKFTCSGAILIYSNCIFRCTSSLYSNRSKKWPSSQKYAQIIYVTNWSHRNSLTNGVKWVGLWPLV